MIKTALVVPTNRPEQFQLFCDNWNLDCEDHWDTLIIVEDNPEKTVKNEVLFAKNVQHFSWTEIDEYLGKESWIISKKDSAIRSFGFLVAHRLGAEFCFTLDDDCYPQDDFFIEGHVNNLTKTSRWTELIPGQRTRGLPYRNTGVSQNVGFSIGLWKGVPDYDAIQTLSNEPFPMYIPETRIMPYGQYFPFCAMNFAFKREMTSLCYFPLMGQNYPYRRFDDIFFGIICKKICDHLGIMIACGKPVIHHSKASDPFENLIKESTGIKQNETFWQIIDQIQLEGENPSECMIEIGKELKQNPDEYLSKLGRAMQIWVQLIQ